jgi:hypothetical protein
LGGEGAREIQSLSPPRLRTEFKQGIKEGKKAVTTTFEKVQDVGNLYITSERVAFAGSREVTSSRQEVGRCQDRRRPPVVPGREPEDASRRQAEPGIRAGDRLRVQDAGRGDAEGMITSTYKSCTVFKYLPLYILHLKWPTTRYPCTQNLPRSLANSFIYADTVH